MGKLTSQNARRHAVMQFEAWLSPLYNQRTQYPKFGANGEFHAINGGFAAMDPATGHLVPPWAFNAGQQVQFAANFAGWVDSQWDGTLRRVNVMVIGGGVENYINPPGQYITGLTTLAMDDDPLTGKLHGYRVKPSTVAAEIIARVSSRHDCISDRLEATVLSKLVTPIIPGTLLTGGIVPGSVTVPQPPAPGTAISIPLNQTGTVSNTTPIPYTTGATKTNITNIVANIVGAAGADSTAVTAEVFDGATSLGTSTAIPTITAGATADQTFTFATPPVLDPNKNYTIRFNNLGANFTVGLVTVNGVVVA